jgi:hypothetical protein
MDKVYSIEKYINSLENHSVETKKTHTNVLNKIDKDISISNSTEEQLWDYIEGLDIKLQTKRNKQFILKSYRRFHQLETSYFEKKLHNISLYEYINSLENHSVETKKTHSLVLNKIEKDISIRNSTEKELWDYIEGLDIKLQTKRNKQFILKSYRQFHKLDTTYFDKKLKKDNTGEYINSATPLPTIKPIKKLPDNFRDLINKIQNKNHKLLLRLLTDYDEILRCDLAFVKRTQIVEDTIVIKESRKTKMPVNIKLKQEDLDLIDHYYDYIIHINAVNRANSYTKLVQRITKQYLGIELSQTDFRHLKSSELFKANEHLPIKQQQELLKTDASKRAHSASVAMSHYIDETDEINVSIKYKKTINILGDDGKLIESYNINEIIKVMNIYKAIKEIC